MFHVELRQFPHQGRAFNLDRRELDQRILGPWLRGELVELQDRKWTPQKAKLTIYEARALEVEEIGLGRGWANVTRTGTEVTGELLQATRAAAAPRIQELESAVLLRAAEAPLSLDEARAVASELGVADGVEVVVWRLLAAGKLRLTGG